MICYRDMTYCAGDGCTKFSGCLRALTSEIREKAKLFGLPIAQFESPAGRSCYEPAPTIERKEAV